MSQPVNPSVPLRSNGRASSIARCRAVAGQPDHAAPTNPCAHASADRAGHPRPLARGRCPRHVPAPPVPGAPRRSSAALASACPYPHGRPLASTHPSAFPLTRQCVTVWSSVARSGAMRGVPTGHPAGSVAGLQEAFFASSPVAAPPSESTCSLAALLGPGRVLSSCRASVCVMHAY